MYKHKSHDIRFSIHLAANVKILSADSVYLAGNMPSDYSCGHNVEIIKDPTHHITPHSAPAVAVLFSTTSGKWLFQRNIKVLRSLF